MKLSDLLEGAPPARYTVDDFVAAGRRRKRRRNAGWAIAAVVAVAIAIGVPQILTRPQAHPVTPAPTPTRALNRLFQTYKVGPLTVGDPEWVGVNNQTTYIGRDRPPGRPLRAVGILDVYRPGFEPPRTWTEKVTPTAPIGGRPAFFASARPGPDNGIWKPVRVLVWKYADNATAVVTAYDRYLGLSEAEMRAVAARFALQATPQPIRQRYTVGWTPPGMRLAAVEYSMRGNASVVFVPDKASTRFVSTALDHQTAGFLYNLDTKNRNFGPVAVPPDGMVIDVMSGGSSERGPDPECGPNEYQDVFATDASWSRQCRVQAEPIPTDRSGSLSNGMMMTVRAGDAVSLDQLRQVAASIRPVGPPERTDSWTPSVEAFPTSAQLPRD
ncbi:hypothetical protein Aab01nite_70450 [Paractinoplanes abujensis]|uniref:Uncharacterized protein n=1 Tax=Paractinoplanes abujensis TaxID=882441 RepID=A0A7W7CW92_9ACTN|nr:hypothetical protein [Actinoplanes abujensis]MBB4695865.1 hypothetical protein [Actinoplanes abujensis]GID23455.1 hypothetical protein Aab01nite_70450 [Actinoplanes abujensis]